MLRRNNNTIYTQIRIKRRIIEAICLYPLLIFEIVLISRLFLLTLLTFDGIVNKREKKTPTNRGIATPMNPFILSILLDMHSLWLKIPINGIISGIKYHSTLNQ